MQCCLWYCIPYRTLEVILYEYRAYSALLFVMIMQKATSSNIHPLTLQNTFIGDVRILQEAYQVIGFKRPKRPENSNIGG